MNKFAIITAAVLATSCVATAAFACDGHGGETAQVDPGEMSPAEVNDALAAGSVVPVDANSAETRTEHGTLPGAVLLTSYEFAAGELPEATDTSLVFYCSSMQCSAAPQAAARAIELGYESVSVMRAGVVGWVEAGFETAPTDSK